MSLYTLLWKKRRPDNQNNDIFWRVLDRSQAEHDPVCHLSFASREIAEAQAQPSQNSQKWMQRCCTLMTSMFMLNASGKVLRLPLKLYVIKHYWGCQKWRHQNWQDCCNENDAEIEQLIIEKLSLAVWRQKYYKKHQYHKVRFKVQRRVREI